MKKILHSLLFIFAFGTMANAQTSASKLNIGVKAGKLTMNKLLLSGDWKMANAQKTLGKATKTHSGYNKTHTYNNSGIVLFESLKDKVPSGNLAEFQVYFSEPDTAGRSKNIMPDGYFTGTFTIENLKLSKDMTFDQVQEGLPGYEKTDSYQEHNYRLANKGLYIYFLFNDTDDRLIKVSVGLDKEAKN
jgi:hypothetical protein